MRRGPVASRFLTAAVAALSLVLMAASWQPPVEDVTLVAVVDEQTLEVELGDGRRVWLLLDEPLDPTWTLAPWLWIEETSGEGPAAAAQSTVRFVSRAGADTEWRPRVVAAAVLVPLPAEVAAEADETAAADASALGGPQEEWLEEAGPPTLPAANADGVPTPGPSPSPTPTPRAACDPAYPDVCIPPPPPDLSCANIPYRNFRVLSPDPHGFDGNKNGIGCEASATSAPAATRTPTPIRTARPAPATPVPTSAAEAAAPCQVGQIKGNRNSKIYHVPGGAYYAITKANVQCFDTEAQAIAAGYRRSSA